MTDTAQSQVLPATARYARTKHGRKASVTYNGERYDAKKTRLTTLVGTIVPINSADHIALSVGGIRHGIHVSRVREVNLYGT